MFSLRLAKRPLHDLDISSAYSVHSLKIGLDFLKRMQSCKRRRNGQTSDSGMNL